MSFSQTRRKWSWKRFNVGIVVIFFRRALDIRNNTIARSPSVERPRRLPGKGRR